jgi:hypothetical protein
MVIYNNLKVKASSKSQKTKCILIQSENQCVIKTGILCESLRIKNRFSKPYNIRDKYFPLGVKRPGREADH